MKKETAIWFADQSTSDYFCYLSPQGRLIAGELFPSNLASETGPRLTLQFFSENPTEHWNSFLPGTYSLKEVTDSVGKKDHGVIAPQSPLWLQQNEDWSAKFKIAQKMFSSGECEKIVLARSRSAQVQTIDHFKKELFSKLVSRAAAHTHKFFLRQNGSVFWGATPEILFSRKKDRILVPAIAGTRFIEGNREQQMASLMNSKKDQREHRLVIQDILEKARALELQLDSMPEVPEILELGSLIHLHTPISFKDPGIGIISNHNLVSALHPTAAIGGLPSKVAHDQLCKLEPWRGLFSSPILLEETGESICLVAIRSALLKEDQFIQFAGAGITSESQENLEWEETKNKMDSLAKIYFS